MFFRTHMFGVPGQHTFFLPVDSAFDVSVQLSGYDYERGRPTGLNKMGVSLQIFEGELKVEIGTLTIRWRSKRRANFFT